MGWPKSATFRTIDLVGLDILGYQKYLNALLYAGVTTVMNTGNVEPFRPPQFQRRQTADRRDHRHGKEQR